MYSSKDLERLCYCKLLKEIKREKTNDEDFFSMTVYLKFLDNFFDGYHLNWEFQLDTY